MLMRGLSDAYGSWNTICMRWRSGRIASRSSATISSPSKRTVPLVGGIRFMQQPAERGLAAAGLAHDAERLAPVDGEATRRRPRGPWRRSARAARRGPGTLDDVGGFEQRLRSRRHSSATRGRAASELRGSGGTAASDGRSAPTGREAAGTSIRRQPVVIGEAAARVERAARRQVDHRRRLAADRAQRLVESPSRRGSESHAARRCRGAPTGRRSRRPSPVSTCRPAYMTITSSATPATTPRSWVISMMAESISSLMADEHLEHLGLHGHVERGGRLVGDQQLRVAGDGHGDHRPLAHAAGELVGVHVDALRRAAGCPTRSSISMACGAGLLLAHPCVDCGPSRRSGGRP